MTEPDNINLLLQSLDEDTVNSTIDSRHNGNVNIIIEEVGNKSRKYNEYGYEIHKSLKNSMKLDDEPGSYKRDFWKTNSNTSIDTTINLYCKNKDVYSDPVFGIRLINPVVPSQLIKTKMNGRLPVPIHKVKEHTCVGDKSSDWVFAGVIVFKSGIKTSQKGSQYCKWKISDLKGNMKQLSLYLFGKSYNELWKESLGTVVAVLNATTFDNTDSSTNDELALMIRNSDQVMIWGTSKDYGICKARKKNGDNCTSFVNKSNCEFCLYHVKSEYNKCNSRRSELVSANGHINLRNKVLGKNEVFYAGKSFAAFKPTTASSKMTEKDRSILSSLNNTKMISDSICNSSKTQSTSSARIQMIKDAGEQMKKTGQPVRVMAAEALSRKSCIKFSQVFTAENIKPNIKKMRQNDLVITDVNSEESLFNHLIDHSANEKISAVVDIVPKNKENLVYKRHLDSINAPKVNRKTTLNESMDTPINEERRPNDIVKVQKQKKSVDDFKTIKYREKGGSSDNEPTKSSNDEIIRVAHNESAMTIIKKQSDLITKCPQMVLSAKKVKLMNAKKHAIELIRSTGTLGKCKKRRKPDLPNDSENVQDTEKGTSIPDRFLELMNAQSSHLDLLSLNEEVEQQSYFDKMIKKEKLEEKMLSTFKVECKAIVCNQCKYKWFSASDVCKSQGHPLKVISAFKRFFKCDNCNNRTVTLEIIPLIPCKQCGQSKWIRAPMLKEKSSKNDNRLCIRGIEESHIGGIKSNNLNHLLL